MAALLRFDDLTIGSNFNRWYKLLDFLNSHNLKAVIGVVPNCIDIDLILFDNSYDEFWKLVKSYQNSGHLIAIHGYSHDCSISLRGEFCKGAIGGEFLGSYDDQFFRMSSAMNIFRRNGIQVDGFMAPRHNFNSTTINILKELNIHTVFDRYFPNFVNHDGITYITNHYSSVNSYMNGFISNSSIAFHIDFLNIAELSKILLLIEKNKSYFFKKDNNFQISKPFFFDFCIDLFYRYYIYYKHFIKILFYRIFS